MKLLIIIISEKMDNIFIPHIENLKKYMDKLEQNGSIIDYAGISSYNDFSNYESIVKFNYKQINIKKQLSKLCDFINTNPDLQYDWYVKIRPEVYLLDELPFHTLSKFSINSRARNYEGSKNIIYGLSVGGKGVWNYITDAVVYNPTKETVVAMDDQIFIFHHNIIKSNGFISKLNGYELQNETTHTDLFNYNKIPLNVIGINLKFDRLNGLFCFSGNIVSNLNN